MKKRLDPTVRKNNILLAAVELSISLGYMNITRDAVAAKAGISNGLVSRYFNTMTQLRRDIIRHSIKQKIFRVIAQGLVCNDKHAKKAPKGVKLDALRLFEKKVN